MSSEQLASHTTLRAVEAHPVLANSAASKALNNGRALNNTQTEQSHVEKQVLPSAARKSARVTTVNTPPQTNAEKSQSLPSTSASKEAAGATRPPPKAIKETRRSTTPQLPTRKRKAKQGPTEGSEQARGTKDSSVKRRKTVTKSKTREKKTGDTDGLDQETVANEESNNVGQTRRRRRSSGTPGRKRQHSPDNAEDLTITATELKMSELCKDRRQGRLSTREMRLRDRDKELAEQKKEAAQENARQQAQDFMDNPEDTPRRAGTTEEAHQDNVGSPVRAPSQASNRNEDDGSATLVTKIVNGQIVPIESSYIIDRHEQANNVDPDDSASVIVEDDLTKRINSATYGKRRPSARWTVDMDELFYDGLRYFGMDFTMIQTLFPKKSRHQIKTKFIKEQRADLNFINQVLQDRKPVPDAEELQKRSGKRLREPSEVYEELAANEAQLREVHRKEEEAQKEAQRQRDKQVEEEGARLGAAIASKKGKRPSIEIDSDTDSDTDSNLGSDSDSDANNNTGIPSTKTAQAERQEVEEDFGFDSDDATNNDASNEVHDSTLVGEPE